MIFLVKPRLKIMNESLSLLVRIDWVNTSILTIVISSYNIHIVHSLQTLKSQTGPPGSPGRIKDPGWSCPIFPTHLVPELERENVWSNPTRARQRLISNSVWSCQLGYLSGAARARDQWDHQLPTILGQWWWRPGNLLGWPPHVIIITRVQLLDPALWEASQYIVDPC